MKKLFYSLAIFFGILLTSFFSIQEIYAQEMEFYQNEKYDFSFEMPTDWRYQEEITLETDMYPIMLFPEEFIIENFAGGDLDLMDMQMKLAGFEFQLESPLISVEFINIQESEVSTLDENNLQEYVELDILSVVPDAMFIDSYTKSHSFGWEVYTKYSFDGNFGLGPINPYTGEEAIFIFKDREAFNISYAAPDSYYDEYKSVYDQVRDTITIKSAVIAQTSEEIDPEIQSIFDDTNETVSDAESLTTNDMVPPRMQMKQGVTSSDVICNDGLELVFKNSDNSPACVKAETAEKLIARGWANIIDNQADLALNIS